MSVEINRRNFITISAGGAVLAALPAAPGWSKAAAAKLDYGVASIDPLYAVAYVALQKGFFGQENLDVNYLNTQSGPRTKQLLAASQIFVGTSGVSDAVALSIAGKQAKVVFGFDQRVPFANILIRKEDYDAGRIRSVKDLAGKSIAVTQPQAATWLMATYIATRSDIVDKTKILGLGDFATMLGALKSGRVDAAISTISMIDSAHQEGWGHTLFDVTDEAEWNKVFGGNVPGVGCYILGETVEKQADTVQAFVNAMSKAQGVLNASTAEQISDIIFKDYLGGYERPAILRALNVYKKGVWSQSNEITAESYNRLTGIMSQGKMYTDAELAKVPFENMIDMKFLAKAKRA
ncbi:MAG: ABC transporter substrate-binding protein [Rhizobiales bacterium]|nr:ABC transporter substrate-binding protein [Hyphomicrobiales bacterium]